MGNSCLNEGERRMHAYSFCKSWKYFALIHCFTIQITNPFQTGFAQVLWLGNFYVPSEDISKPNSLNSSLCKYSRACDRSGGQPVNIREFGCGSPRFDCCCYLLFTRHPIFDFGFLHWNILQCIFGIKQMAQFLVSCSAILVVKIYYPMEAVSIHCLVGEIAIFLMQLKWKFDLSICLGS